MRVGRRVSHFRVLEMISEGGMGEVYRGVDTRLQRPVALKFLPSDLQGDEQARARFIDEAQAASALVHPNICVIHEIDRSAEGQLFIAMAFYHGRTLDRREKGQAAPIKDVLGMVCQIARGLRAAHQAGIVHRDVKPSNLLLSAGGEIKILDFGIAKLKGRTHRTNAGDIIGTVAYMSPEQIRGDETDARSDIFSLGTVFYELLTGRHPFGGGNPASVMHRVLEVEPERASLIRPGLDPRIDQVLAWMLAKDVVDRPQTADELLARLEQLEACVDVPASEMRTAPMPLPVFGRRERRPTGRIALTLAAVLVVVAAALTWSWLRAPPEPLERQWLLISDFENSTGLPVFDSTLAEALALNIEQSRHINVVSRERIFDALVRMKRDDAEALDEALAMEVCRREGVPTMLTGSVRRVGETFQIVVRGIEVASGEVFYSTSEVFRQQDELFARADALAGRVRKRLGERPLAEQSLPLEKATTASLEALQLSTQARDLMLRGEFAGATRLLQGALEIDPEFATAHIRLASAHELLGRLEEAARHFERAFALRSGVSEREYYFIEGTYYGSQELYERSVESFHVLVGLYPDDLDAHHGLALAYGAMGRPVDAIRELREVLRLDPFDDQAYGNLILFLAQTNANSEAIEVYRSAVERELDSPYLRWGLGLASLGDGRSDEARRHFEHLEAQGGPFQPLGSLYLARADVYEGYLDRAQVRLSRDLRGDLQNGNLQYEALRRQLIAEIDFMANRRGDARRQLESMLALGPALQVDNLRAAGSLYARLGDLEEAQSILRQVEILGENSPAAYFSYCEHNLRGEIALARGDPEGALGAFETAALAYPDFGADHGAARAHSALGAWDEAIAGWQRVIERKGEILRHDFPALYAVARVEQILAYQSAGRLVEAQALCGRIDGVWVRTESIPRYSEACGATVSRSPLKL